MKNIFIMPLKKELFDKIIDDVKNSLYVLQNSNGMEVCVMNYGAKIVSLVVPDQNGTLKDVVLGYSSIDEYLSGEPTFGATCGRYSNRLSIMAPIICMEGLRGLTVLCGTF